MRCLMRNWWINHRIFRQYPWVFIQLTFTFPSAVGQNTSILLFTWACSKSSCFLWIFIPHKNMVIPSFRPPKSHIFPKKSPKNHLQSLQSQRCPTFPTQFARWLSPPACGEPQVTTLPSTSAAKALWLPTTALTDTEDSEETEAGKLPPVRLSPQGCREPDDQKNNGRDVKIQESDMIGIWMEHK